LDVPNSLTNVSSDNILDRLQSAAFGYFVRETNLANGLVADSTRAVAPASIAVVGFALSVYPIAVDRGWMQREQAVERVLLTLRFFWRSSQGDTAGHTGYKGFYYHFLDLQSGQRTWQSELSLIDTSLLLAGALTAAAYFTEPTRSEAEIRELADALYRRVEWTWAQDDQTGLSQGWKPESGFLHYGWEGYNEAILLYVLALASPTHPLPSTTYDVWTSTYQWENLYGYDFLYAGPLFVHQFSHAWVDLRGIRDRFMREKRSDYFENSRRATYVQREYSLRNPHGFRGYGQDCWGLTASDGPGIATPTADRPNHRRMGYAARGVPYGPDDGTIAPWAALASLPFAPEIALSSLRHYCEQYPGLLEDYMLPSGFNPTLPGAGPQGWVSEGHFGLDQGIIVLMIENYRTQLVWKLMRDCPYIRRGLRCAGFRGGWL